METMRKSWTDERLDDFAGETARRFDTLERRMDDGFNRVDAELRAVNARFDALQRTMLQLGGGVIAALIGLIATQL
jgi:hypothetical protein